MAEEAKKEEVKKESLWKQFKKFITRGNVLDLAVGVIIGGAFNAIVNALVSILMSVCTWGVPGGINGLITVLPAANSAQKGVEGIGQTFDVSELSEKVIVYAKTLGTEITEAEPAWINQLKTIYTQYGNTFVYNQSAMINWGSLINAVISFLIIALTLFIIVKAVTAISVKRKALEVKIQAEIKKEADKLKIKKAAEKEEK